MQVHMHARLAGGLANIGADVVTVGPVFFLDALARVVEKCEHRRLFGVGHVEEIGHVAPRHDDHVARRQGIAVVARIRELVLGDDVGRLAELAAQKRRPTLALSALTCPVRSASTTKFVSTKLKPMPTKNLPMPTSSAARPPLPFGSLFPHT